MKLLISAVSLWALAGGLLPAAPAGKKIAVRFAAQTAPANLGDLVMTAGEIRSAPFALPLNNLSEALTAPARAFRLELQEKPTVLATVTLPEAGSDFIILLVPAVKSGFEAVVLPAGDGSFRPGDYYLHNVSRNSVVGKVGTTNFIVPPRAGKVVRPDGAREGRFYDVALGVREGETARVISTSRWPVGKQMRTYVFFFDNPQSQDIDFRAIDEFVPPANAAPGRAE
jgi:hypothetical protein